MVAAQHCRLVHKKYLPLGVTSNREWQFSLETCRVRSRISWNLQLQGPFQNILLHTQERPSSSVRCRLPEPGRLVQDILTQFLLLPSRQVGWGQLSVGCTVQPDQMDVGRQDITMPRWCVCPILSPKCSSLWAYNEVFWILNFLVRSHDLITGFNLHSIADPGCLSRILDPDFFYSGFRIKQQQQKEEEKLVVWPFLAINFTKLKKYLFLKR